MEDMLMKYLELLIKQQNANNSDEVQERIDRVNDAIEQKFLPQAQGKTIGFTADR